MIGNDQAFRQFAERQYQFGWWLGRQRDTARRHPQVRAAHLALAVIAQVFFGLRSLLRVDQWLRPSLAVAWRRCASTGPRGSDTTLLKALGAWDRARWRQASYALHLVVKTQEATLDVVQSCRAAWQGGSDAAWRAVGVAVARGVDDQRTVAYVVCAQRGIAWDELDDPLNVAWVRETPLKGKRAGQTEEFWVLTTDATLRAAELRAVAHARWAIENLGFTATNAQVGSKLGYIRTARVKAMLLLLWNWGLALLGAGQWWLSQQPAWQQWRVRKTKWWIGLVLTVTALGGEMSGCGGSP